MSRDIIYLVILLTVLGNADARHIAANEQRIRSPTRTRLVVVRGPGNERKLVLLNNPRFIPLSNGRQLDVNVTKADNEVGGATIENSGKSQINNSLIGSHKILSPDVDLSNRSRLRIGSSIRDQPLSNARSKKLSSAPPSVKVSDKVVDGVDINAQGSFGDINIPKVIEVALNRLRGDNRQLSRDMNEHSNHVHVDSIGTVIGQNIKLDSMHSMGLKPPASRAASMIEAATRVLGPGLQTMPASRPHDIKGTHEPSVHSRRDQGPIGPVGLIQRLFEPKMSNSSRHQPSSGEKLNTADAVPLSIMGISSSKGVGLSSTSSSILTSYMNTANDIESQLPISSSSVAGNASNSAGLKNDAVKVEPLAHADKLMIGEPYFAYANNNGAVPLAMTKSLPGVSASAVSHSSFSSSKRSTQVIQKAVRKTTITKTRVISGKTNTEVAATSAARGSSTADAASVGVNIASSTESMPPAVVSTNQPSLGGSIEVQKESNGKTKIILKDANNNPIVLQATGPVEIQRIVTPNGGIKFIVNPIRQRVVEESELDAEEILATITAAAEETEPPTASTLPTTPEVEQLAQTSATAIEESRISTTDIPSVTTTTKRSVSTGTETTIKPKSSENAPKMRHEPNRNQSAAENQVSKQVVKLVNADPSKLSTTALS